MLDNRAKVWWAELRQQGELSALPGDYAFRNFTDERGKPVRITGDESVLMQIGDLAREIRKVLVPPPAPDRAPVAEPNYSDVFILGHPIHRFSEEVAAQADALADAAREQGLRVNMWRDGWLKGSAVGAKPEDLLGRNAVFVQPLAAGEASDHVAEVGKTQRQLTRLGIQNARVVLWLPSEQSDPEFEAHAV